MRHSKAGVPVARLIACHLHTQERRKIKVDGHAEEVLAATKKYKPE
ncbi:MAG TPA: hypothetical protein VIQ03_14160 [Gammaproteobacteria bacterium]